MIATNGADGGVDRMLAERKRLLEKAIQPHSTPDADKDAALIRW